MCRDRKDLRKQSNCKIQGEIHHVQEKRITGQIALQKTEPNRTPELFLKKIRSPKRDSEIFANRFLSKPRPAKMNLKFLKSSSSSNALFDKTAETKIFSKKT